MKYFTEKDQLIQKIEEIIQRESVTAKYGDAELLRLVRARQVLLGEENSEASSESNGTSSASRPSVEVDLNGNLVGEFSKAYSFLNSLKQEKNYGKAILGLIEVGLFLLTVVTALSAKEASRAAGR